jgi:C1A family cysteine protease
MPINGHGTGWLVDFPDLRDYTPENPKVYNVFGSKSISAPVPIPRVIDNRKYCSPIKNQGSLGSCTAFAAVGMYEYMEKKIHNKFVSGSELFVYKVTRYLMSTRNESNGLGDTGAFIRSALGALVYFGVPPGETYPYNISLFEAEPPTKVYILAQNYQVLTYFRLDYEISNPQSNLDRIKTWIYRGFPIEFGFTCYNSTLKQAETTGNIPYPSSNDNTAGGHAMMICGYNDDKIITNSDNGQQTTGAFLIRNSWGEGWGGEMKGYGYLPYEYIMSGNGLAQDFWVVTRTEWVEKDQFHV